MVTVKLEILATATAGSRQADYAGRATTGQPLAGQEFPQPQNEDWQNDSYWDATKKFVVLFTNGVWSTCYNNNVLLYRNARIPIGFYDRGNTFAPNVQMRLSINGVIVKTVTFNNSNNDFTYYQLSGYVEAPTPTYLETLDKLDQWSSAQYIPNSGNKLNL